MRLAIASLAAAMLLAAMPLTAQTSIGFADPDHLDALLDYRLPDWGYRTWDGTLNFAGNGRDGDSVESNHRLNLATTATFYRESERRVWLLDAYASGSFNRDHYSTESESSTARSLNGRAELHPRLDHYLGDSDLFVRVAASALAHYNEQRNDFAGGFTAYRRTYEYGITPGLGIGRVRDVTPLIRAQRLSERLVALDRPPLTDAQVVAVAQVLAQEGGYRIVFDRADRRFWRDVLEPLLDPERPLSVYEIMYLEEILLESVGSRRQGQSLSVYVGWRENQIRTDETRIDTARRVGAFGEWVRNLSLVQQLQFTGGVDYVWNDYWFVSQEYGYARLGAAYLHNVNDRNRLDVSVSVEGRYGEDEAGVQYRYLSTRFRIEDRFYVEDRVVLRPRISLRHVTASGSADNYGEPELSWEYGLSLDYYFDRLLY